MKDFAGSSITYYGLAREKLMNKYPRLISILMILALISMTGLTIFLISDLASFASNPDHDGVLASLDLKSLENGIASTTNDKEKIENTGVNSSQNLENLSSQTKEQDFASLPQKNDSQPSIKAVKEVIDASKSSSSNSPVKHHSSSSSSSSAKSAKKSNYMNNLTNETAKGLTPTNQSMNNSQRSNDSQVAPAATLASFPSAAIGSITNTARDTSAREPESIIKFKTDNQVNADGATSAKKKPSLQVIRTKSTPSQKSKVAASDRTQKIQEARAKQATTRNRMAENLKTKAAQSRAKAAKK